MTIKPATIPTEKISPSPVNLWRIKNVMPFQKFSVQHKRDGFGLFKLQIKYYSLPITI